MASDINCPHSWANNPTAATPNPTALIPPPIAGCPNVIRSWRQRNHLHAGRRRNCRDNNRRWRRINVSWGRWWDRINGHRRGLRLRRRLSTARNQRRTPCDHQTNCYLFSFHVVKYVQSLLFGRVAVDSIHLVAQKIALYSVTSFDRLPSGST